MVFSSHIFIYYFLPVLLAGYFALYFARQRTRNLWLVVTGYVFYGWANPKFIFLMFATTFVDWLLSLVIVSNNWRFWRAWRISDPLLDPHSHRTSRQRAALTASIVSNLAMLGFFKYFNFGVDSYNDLVAAMGLEAYRWDSFFRIILPLGISFYTFQSMSYIIDVYRGHARAMRNFIDFSCFVSMCPHLVAGPILKFSYMADQLEHRVLTLEKFARGAAFFAMGLAKKVLIANPCGKVADTVFNAGSAGTLDSWFGAAAYSFQIYFDFSGYSDMAIGLGLMLGFVFAKNFDSPYKSESITEFWRRWHISLSTWLKEYLYIPLGGNRKGKSRTYLNLIVTMLLGGLWHGAAWTFVVWGAIHGAMLALERAAGKNSFYRRMPQAIRVALTFLIVTVAWVFFRSPDIASAMRHIGAMLAICSPQECAGLIGGLIYQPYYMICMCVAAGVTWLSPDTWSWTRQLSWQKVGVCAAAMWIALIVLATQQYNPFIYFIF